MTTRREFVAMAASAAVLPHLAPSARAGKVILFQGDSITDCGRNRKSESANDASALGTGYPLLIAGALRDHDVGGDLQIFNRGVSGNTVPDLRARWEHDTLDLKPAVLSILIGVNDKWRTMDSGSKATVGDYETAYRTLLTDSRAALPGVHLVVLEPFVLHTGAVSDAWFPDFDQYRAAAARVAREAGATFIALHGMFQDLARKNAPAYWAADGVHPTVAGHRAIAEEWVKRVKI